MTQRSRSATTKYEMLDFVRTRLRGTSERITLYEIQRLKPEVEATLNARVLHETERYAGREWLRAFAEDELAVGERRILELDKCDVVVHRGPNGYLAFNNACPHVRLPFYDRKAAQRGACGQAAAAAERCDRRPWHRLSLARQAGAGNA